TNTERREREDLLRNRLRESTPGERDRIEQQLAELDVAKDASKGSDEAQPIDRVLKTSGCVVMLGGPGSGKTTLAKRLARSFAVGAEVARERYPEIRWGLPIVVPVVQFDAHGGEGDLFQYIVQRLDEIGGKALVRAFRTRWGEGECLVLLDGLDEIADT